MTEQTPETPAGGVQLERVTYIRQVKPPTLAQFIRRKATQEAAQATRGETGVVIVGGRPVPRSSVIMQEKLKRDTHELAAEHPEWVQEYKEVYGGKSEPGTTEPGTAD